MTDLGRDTIGSSENGAARRAEVIIITGLSGAGMSTAATALEDLGWFVADNLPPQLVISMIDLAVRADPPLERLAIVMDVRSRLFTGDLGQVVNELAARPVQTRVLFLEASDAVLVRRFEQVRRSHPLQADTADRTLIDGIAAERGQLAPVKGAADLVVDTSALTGPELRRKIETAFGDATSDTIQVTVESFGFKYGLPMDSDLVCDVRFLPNPHCSRTASADRPRRAGARLRPGPRECAGIPRQLSADARTDDGRLPSRGQALHDDRGRVHRWQAPQCCDDRSPGRSVERRTRTRRACRAP